jgi:hypothetical protein
MTGRHLLSHSFTEKGQRKKIIDDHDKLCSEIEISKLLSNNKIFQHGYQFQQYIIDVCTNFSEVISAKKFFYRLCLNSSVYRYVYFQKTQTDKFKSKSKQKENENANKNEIIYIIYKGSYHAKYLFRAWPFTG